MMIFYNMHKALLRILSLTFLPLILLTCNQPVEEDCTIQLATQISVPIDDQPSSYTAYVVYQNQGVQQIDLPGRSHYFKSNSDLDSIGFTVESLPDSVQLISFLLPAYSYYHKFDSAERILEINRSDPVNGLAVFGLSNTNVSGSLELEIDVYFNGSLAIQDTMLSFELISRKEMSRVSLPTMQNADHFAVGFTDPCDQRESISYGFLSERGLKLGNVWSGNYWSLSSYEYYCFVTPRDFNSYYQ